MSTPSTVLYGSSLGFLLFLRHIDQNIPHEMQLAALPWGVGKGFTNCRNQSGVCIWNDKPGRGQTTVLAASPPRPPWLCTAIPAYSASDPAASHIAVAILSDLWYSFCEPLGSLLYIMIFSTTIILQESWWLVYFLFAFANLIIRYQQNSRIWRMQEQKYNNP